MTQGWFAILVVTYNSAVDIGASLDAAVRAGGEVLVIDNASSDDTVAIARSRPVRVLANAENRGFAAAVNQGVRATNQPFLLLLNPDAVLETGVEALVAACEIPGIAAAGGALVDENGAPQAGFNVRAFPTPLSLACENLLLNRLWPHNPVNWHYRCLGFDLTTAMNVDQPAGAFLMFRRDAWETVRGFDEGFFPIWFEDVDFCKRLNDAGFRIRYSPSAVARHRGAHSIEQVPRGTRTEYWYRSLLRYAITHFHAAGRIFTCLSLIAGSFLRPAFGGAKHRSPEMVRSYRVVRGLAARSIFKSRVEFGEIVF